MVWILDLDGVIWLADEPIRGSAAAVEELRARGERVVFTTNNSFLTTADYVAKLSRAGISVSEDDVVTSAAAAASLLPPGASVVTCAGMGVTEALRARGIEPVALTAGVPGPPGPVDALVVGYHLDFGYETLSRGAALIREGALFIGTNEDPTYPTPSGLLAGTGALLAAFETASGRAPVLAGKPHDPMVALVRDRFRTDGQHCVVVGDRPSTDGLFAARLGARFGLVLSGVTPPGTDPASFEVTPDAVARDLADLVQTIGSTRIT